MSEMLDELEYWVSIVEETEGKDKASSDAALQIVSLIQAEILKLRDKVNE